MDLCICEYHSNYKKNTAPTIESLKMTASHRPQYSPVNVAIVSKLNFILPLTNGTQTVNIQCVCLDSGYTVLFLSNS